MWPLLSRTAISLLFSLPSPLYQCSIIYLGYVATSVSDSNLTTVLSPPPLPMQYYLPRLCGYLVMFSSPRSSAAPLSGDEPHRFLLFIMILFWCIFEPSLIEYLSRLQNVNGGHSGTLAFYFCPFWGACRQVTRACRQDYFLWSIFNYTEKS